MSKYTKLFDTTAQYEAYAASTGFVTPNVSVCKDAMTTVHYHPLVVAKLYDYLYEDGSFGKKDATKTAIAVW